MAVYFFDSSAIVKRYLSEVGSAWVTNIAALVAGNEIYLARITFVEVISAVTRKARGSGLSATGAMKAIADFRQDFANEYPLVELTPTLIESAAGLAETHALRAYDAVQLAAALAINTELTLAGVSLITVVSADQALNTAAIALKDLQLTTRTLILRNRSKEVNELRSNNHESRLTKTLVSGHRRGGNEFRSVHKVLGVGKATRR